MRLKKFHGFKLFAIWLKQWLNVYTRPLAGIFFKSSKLIINEKVDHAKFNNPKRAFLTNGTSLKVMKLITLVLIFFFYSII